MVVPTGGTPDDYRNAIDEELKKQFNVGDIKELADHVAHCLPPSVGTMSFAKDGRVNMADRRYEWILLLNC